jgi:neutral ceramidase
MIARSGLTIFAGTVDITPDTMLPLFGRAGRTRRARTVASRLEANCLMILGSSDGPTALVTIDSLYPSADLVEAVLSSCAARGLVIDPHGLVIVASHTHNAPALDLCKPKLGRGSFSYLGFVSDRITECLLQLSQKAQSEVTLLSNGFAECAASVYRRNALWGIDFSKLRLSRRVVMSPNPSRCIDQTLKLLLFSDDAGHPRAVLWTWPCHAVSEPDALVIGADFPGSLRNHIRSSLAEPTLPVLYFPGFSGDIRPTSSSRIPISWSGKWIVFGARFRKSKPRSAERLHKKLAAAFERASREIQPLCRLADVTFSRTRRILPLGEIRDNSGELSPLTCDDWKLGPIRIRALSAEIASGYVKTLGENDPRSFLTGCAGQVFGYVPIDSQLSEGGYEVEGFAAGFSVPGRFRDAIETKIADLIAG